MKSKLLLACTLLLCYCGALAQNRTFTVGGVSFEMVPVEGGTFYMGAQYTDPNGINYDEEAYDSESPVHKVTLSDYYIAKFEITQSLWYAVTKLKPHAGTTQIWNNYPSFINDDYPAFYICREDLQRFISALNDSLYNSGQLTNYSEYFAIPTEAQWEFAARGGNKSKGYIYAGSNDYTEVAWTSENSPNDIQKVGQKKPNELGIYDMSGNVLEWCKDMYWDYTATNQTNPYNDYGTYHSLRGGYHARPAVHSRITRRHYAYSDQRSSYYGARLALIAQIPKNTTKISENTISNFTLEQNPVGENLRLKGAKLNDVVKIFSIDGRQIYSNTIKSEQIEINISSFSSGIYILQIGTEQTKFVKK